MLFKTLYSSRTHMLFLHDYLNCPEIIGIARRGAKFELRKNNVNAQWKSSYGLSKQTVMLIISYKIISPYTKNRLAAHQCAAARQLRRTTRSWFSNPAPTGIFAILRKFTWFLSWFRMSELALSRQLRLKKFVQLLTCLPKLKALSFLSAFEKSSSCFHLFGMIQTCTYLRSSMCSQQ